MRDYLIGSPRDTVSELPTREWLAGLEQAIRNACETLSDPAAGEVSAASVTLSQGVDGQVALLLGLIDDLSDEYGLYVSLRLGHSSVTARFTTAPSV